MKEYIVGLENEHDHALDVCYKKELILCQDCRHFNRLSCPMAHVLPYEDEVKVSSFIATFINKATDYCSFAERREENGK